MPTVTITAAEAPLVLALDLGTSSLRALVYDRLGRAVEQTEEQLRHQLRTTPDGGAETDAASLFDLLLRCIDGAAALIGERAADLVAVGTTCFWHSLLGLDAGGNPVTPLLTWADTRAAPFAAPLRRRLDADALHQRTGCRIHTSYWPAKLAWFRAEHSARAEKVARWVSFAEYATLRLCGEPNLTASMASGTGLLDIHVCDWDGELLEALDLEPSHLSRLAPDAEPMTLQPEYGRRWPALARLPWFGALGDGACANVGSGAISPRRIALTLGTSGAMRLVVPAPVATATAIPPDLWAYRLDRERLVLGGALSNGGNLLRWLGELVGAPPDSDAAQRAIGLPPDSHGLTLLPFVAGERSPGWHDRAAGVVAGLTLATAPEHLLRAAAEAIAYRFARVYDALIPLAETDHELVANGGAILPRPDLLQLVADTLGHELLALLPDDEATARGAAATALVAIGAQPALETLPDPAAGADHYQPDSDRQRIYAEGRQRHESLERTLYGGTAAPWRPEAPCVVPSGGRR
jgi:gluconokinase